MTYTEDTIVYYPLPRRSDFKNLTGQQFDSLTVIGFAGAHLEASRWWCRCLCGAIIRRASGPLRRNPIQNCGQWTDSHNGTTTRTHGQTGSRLYRIWRGIKNRCRNPKVREYPRYGGRGITMDDAWYDSFEIFAAYVDSPPSPQHSIDRFPNNNGNYEPGNVRWATKREQSNNRNDNTWLTYQGRTQTQAMWARELHMHPDTLMCRIQRQGWPIEKAFTTPVQLRKRAVHR